MPAPAPSPGQPATAAGTAYAAPGAALGRPRLVELGSVRCNACKEMMKVLDALRASQGGRLQVDFIDVFENPAMGDQFGLKMIPTQILYDAQGKELFRHIGFFSHDEILAKFREHGVKL
jgi:thioredoxin 1